MTTTPCPGDILIRHFGETSYALVDAVTHEQLAIAPELQVAVKVASERGGAVWRENVDHHGLALGTPVLLVPRASVPRP